jgi:hypothetical protein
LDCPTAANRGFAAKELFDGLSNRTGPPHPERRTPAIWEDHGAQKADQLGGLIEGENRSAAARTQPSTCENCGTTFKRRKRSGGKPQKFCSTDCRKAFHASRNGNVGQRGQRATLGNAPAVIGDYPEEKTHPAAAGGQDFDWSADRDSA